MLLVRVGAVRNTKGVMASRAQRVCRVTESWGIPLDTQAQEISSELLEILACPACKGDIEYNQEKQQLICIGQCKRRYPIRDGIPVMLIDEAEMPGDEA